MCLICLQHKNVHPIQNQTMKTKRVTLTRPYFFVDDGWCYCCSWSILRALISLGLGDIHTYHYILMQPSLFYLILALALYYYFHFSLKYFLIEFLILTFHNISLIWYISHLFFSLYTNCLSSHFYTHSLTICKPLLVVYCIFIFCFTFNLFHKVFQFLYFNLCVFSIQSCKLYSFSKIKQQ